MTHDDLLEKLRDTKKAMGWTNQDIAQRSGVHVNSVDRTLKGENVSLYKFMDILHGMGIEFKII